MISELAIWISDAPSSVNMIFLQIIDAYVTYNLSKFQINSIKIEKFLLNKEIHAGLNLWGIILKFSQILEIYVTYNLWKFQIDSIKIEA